MMTRLFRSLCFLLLGGFAGAAATADNAAVQILNVSYDVSRDLFAQINPAFATDWQARKGRSVTINQSHSGSSAQARAVAEGLPADVVTFNQVTDIEFLRKAGYVSPDWSSRLPNSASPYYSLPIFLVRAGNPKNIRDWNDLIRPGVSSVFPNPKTSGNGRYTYLAAYLYALDRSGGDQAAANDFVARFVRSVPVFDTGGRGAKAFQVVVPSVSLRADFPVAVVDKVVDRRGTRALAIAYLEFLYSDAGQDILAKNFNRVNNPTVAARYKASFPEVRLLTVEDKLGSWEAVTKVHFADGGLLDKALLAGR